MQEHQYEATFFEMSMVRIVARAERAPDMFQPILLRFGIAKFVCIQGKATDRDVIPWPRITCELGLVGQLCAHGPNWTISLLEHKIGGDLCECLVTGARELPYAELLADATLAACTMSSSPRRADRRFSKKQSKEMKDKCTRKRRIRKEPTPTHNNKHKQQTT